MDERTNERTNERKNGRMDGRTNNAKTISPSRFHWRGIKMVSELFNSYPAEFLKWNSLSSIFGTVHYHFYVYQDENFMLVSQQYTAWSDCTNVQAGLAL